MLQIVGLIVAVYTVARLLQVPIEHSTSDKRTTWLWLIAVAGVIVIGLLTMMLLVSGVPTGL